MTSKQIVTLQCGTYANYIGAHYWNLQEEYIQANQNVQQMEINADMLFRQGETQHVSHIFSYRLTNLNKCILL